MEGSLFYLNEGLRELKASPSLCWGLGAGGLGPGGWRLGAGGWGLGPGGWGWVGGGGGAASAPPPYPLPPPGGEGGPGKGLEGGGVGGQEQ